MGSVRKVLCSIGCGPYAELLSVSSETFGIYAERHGYELELRNEAPPIDRPISWARLPLIQELLLRFDVVLWIDADAAIVDPSVDIADLLPRRDLMGLVAHVTPEGREPIPNCGVWILRPHRMTRQFLGEVWRATEYVDHKWWENAAVMDRLGYQLEPQVRLERPTAMARRTRFLPTEWNSISVDQSPASRIVHFPGRPLAERLAGLRAAVEELRDVDGALSS
jgi:hypothetical protein